MMKEKLQNIKEEALKAIEAADMPEKLNDVRVKFLGKKGELTAVLKGMKDVAPEKCGLPISYGLILNRLIYIRL